MKNLLFVLITVLSLVAASCSKSDDDKNPLVGNTYSYYDKSFSFVKGGPVYDYIYFKSANSYDYYCMFNSEKIVDKPNQNYSYYGDSIRTQLGTNWTFDINYDATKLTLRSDKSVIFAKQ